MDENGYLPPDVPRRRLARDLTALILIGAGVAAVAVAAFMVAIPLGIATVGVAAVAAGAIVGTSTD